jgi:hypothetical protein
MSLLTINVGDTVIDKYGAAGKIIAECNCEECKKRGYAEYGIQYESGLTGWITDHDFINGCLEYYQIGNNVWPQHVDVDDLYQTAYQWKLESNYWKERALAAYKLIDIATNAYES